MKLQRWALLLLGSGAGWWLSASLVSAQVNTSYSNLILGNTSPVDLAILIINWSLGILALIALVVILWGGFIWMLAQGDEEKINRAKTILRNGVIGLLIILAAWGIATYIINLLLDVTNAGDTYATPNEPYEPSDGSPFYVDHSNPHDGEDNVTLCHIVAVTFSYPLNTDSVNDSSFAVTIPYDAISNPTGGKPNGENCTDNKECLSGVCDQVSSNECRGESLLGSFKFSESAYSAVFYPDSDYFSDTIYQVKLSTDIQGIDPETGAVYNLTSGDSKRDFTFTTGTETDNIPPKVDVANITPYPNDAAAGICLNPTLQAAFSESLDPATPSDKNFWLYTSQDNDGDGTADTPSDQLDIDYIRFGSLGGEADDTIATKPQDQLAAFTEYGINLYSGDAANKFDGAIADTCGNPLSGDFDDNIEGSPTDDFVDPTSAGLSQAFCTCTSGADSCKVTGGSDSCTLSSGDTCALGATCDGNYESFVGFQYQWTWTTSDQAYCVPEIDDVAQQDTYYSEDEPDVDTAEYGSTGSEDTGKALITGKYLYPFYDLDFYKNISAAGMSCFDTSYSPIMSCFVSNTNDTAVTVRTPVASQTGHISVQNGDGSDTSADVAIIDSPYIWNTSPLSGPAGQYVTIRGKNFGDYDPTVEGSQRGHVYFDGVEAQVMCTDGWDDDQIIIQVPQGFDPAATPNIQVVATGPDNTVDTDDDKHSNQEAFTITDGEPGPGLCELEPQCSDTGQDDITAIGENFGSDGAVYFDPSQGDYVQGSVQSWNVYNDQFASYSVVTNGTPVTEHDTYTFTAGNTAGISNGLDFKISCSEPPKVFEYYQCDLNNTFYLPNPRGYENNACVNSVIYFAFDQNMADSTVSDGVKVYQCNSGDSFDDASCTTEVTGSFVVEYLNNAYIGGDGTVMLDGTTDSDGDGDIDVSDAYSAYTFYPATSFLPNYFYKMVIPTTVTNDNSVAIEADYAWNFQVRDDATNCVADYLSLAPYSQIENNYDAFDACLDNYIYDDISYTFRARPASSDCFVLDDAGDYTWTIDNDKDKSVLGFGSNGDNGDTVTSKTLSTSTRGYNTVCLQGDEQSNEGDAVVTANLLDPNTHGVAVSDTGVVTVDFGYCTQDSDCYTQDCRDTYCDPLTSHCAPDVIGFTPNNDASADVGPTGCLTINGCYFGTDQHQPNTCTCTSLKQSGVTCAVDEGATTCLLADRTTTCSLGEATCTLDQTCSEESAAADYNLGFFNGCTCTLSATQSCTVASGTTTCVAPGNDVCTPLYSTYQTGATGSVTLNSQAVTYPDVQLCSDTWNNNQVIIKIPNDGSVPADDYAITLNSYYNLGDIFGTDAGDAYNCTVGSTPTPCLCLADPDYGEETNLIDLFGEGFNLLTKDGDQAVTFAGSVDRVASQDATWVDEHTVTDADIAKGAVSAADGVELQSTNYTSNALDFTVSCSSNLDCSTGCCYQGQCSAAEKCNTCIDDIDCSYGSCQSACVNGVCAPDITAISPAQGAVGQPVTIQGCYFGSYYSPDQYTPGSQVTVDSLAADLACNVADSWNNQQIIITMPDGIFANDEDTIAAVQVQQSYTSNGQQTSQLSNTVDFTKDNSCSAVNLPVLCAADPAYSPYQTLTDDTENITLSGENFYDENGGYCTCQLPTLGECYIHEGSTSCTKSTLSTYFVNPDNTAETCSDGSTGTATVNAYTVYQPTTGACIYTDKNDSSVTCTIAVGDSYCQVSSSETCYVDDADHSQICDSSIDGFVALDGAVDYYNNVPANIDWPNYYDTQYVTDVPEGSSTGDVKAIATTSDNIQCVSNGLEFPVTCNSCSDCAYGDNLNCNLDYDPAFGACTADTTGFCRAAPSSCCNNTSCVYDDANADDAGTCAPQPLLVLDDSDGDGVSDAEEDRIGYDSHDTDSDDDTIPDSEQAGTTTGNTTGDIVAASTNPGPNDTGVCPNAQFTLQLDQPITTSTAYPYNNNEVTADEADSGVDVTADDIPLADIDFSNYVYLRPASTDDNATTSVLSDVNIDTSETTLTLTLDQILDFSTQYEIMIKADDAVVSGEANQSGIVSLADGVAVGCSSDQAALGLCSDGYIKLTFTTTSQANYQSACGPSYALLDSTDQKFVDNNYTFTKSGQQEPFAATVSAAGEDYQPDNGTADANGDGVDDGDDDQAIQRIDDGADAGYYWTYAWDPVYATLADLENNACPVAGIISEDTTGSCACTLSESCTIAVGDPSCTTASGITCETDSPDGTCYTLDSHYTSNGCSCTVAGSCTISAGDASCSASVNGTTVSCSTDASSGVCDETDSNWESGAFSEDQATQTVTADSPDTTQEASDTVNVTVTGDGSVEQGWGNTSSTSDDLTDSILVDVQYCPDADYLVSYNDEAYNFYWSYCRGSDPQATSFLPKFDVAFERSDSTVPTIDEVYGKAMDFVYEVAFRDASALTNDPSANNNTVAMRVYPNDLDGNTQTIADSVDPALWYLLNTNDTESGSSTTTVNNYQAITVGNTTYVAISNLTDSTGAIQPYIFVIAYSADASKATTNVVKAIGDGLKFNHNDSLSNECGLTKAEVIRDTKRVNDLGTIAYLLNSYYFNDSDGNSSKDFPSLAEGSYIAGLSTSLWPSWDTTLGNALGQSLPADPTNAFYDAAKSCPYNPPDVAAGETSGTYYDEAGTCWDPVLKDFYGPAGSSTYLYQQHDATDFGLYANLEYIDTDDTNYNPCRYYEDGSTVDASISDYSNKGCSTFNYKVDDSQTTANATYAKLF